MVNTIIYTGVGSRDTPDEILSICTEIAKNLAEKNWTLRSGGAEGCDNAFEIGCDMVDGIKEIYLPWRNFNNNTSNLYHIPQQAYASISKFHPNPTSLKEGAIKLIARDSQQVLGQFLTRPSDILIYYAKINSDGSVKGGTGQAVRIAKYYNIPTINILDIYKLNLSTIMNIIYERIKIK